jgi:signal transduction histidine kinase
VENAATGNPVLLIADRTMLRHMLGNLLSNAVKFTPKGGDITISLTADETEGVRLSVADTGVGIAAESIESILQPFHQAEDTLTRRHGGTGLGLSLVDNMISLHDGKMEIDSTPGQGTTVTLRFPPGRLAAGPSGQAAAANA